MKTSQEFIDEIKTKSGEQVTRDGRLIRDIDDKELMKKMLERYPGERENIVDIDEYLGEEAQSLPTAPPKSDVQEQLDKVSKSPGFLERVKNRWVQSADKAQEIDQSDQNSISKFIQSAGEGASLISDVAFEGVKALTPQPIEDAIGAVVTAAGQKLAENETVQKTMQGYQSFKEKYPEAAANLEAVVNVAEFIPLAKGVKKTGEVVVDATKSAIPKIDEMTDGIRVARSEARQQKIDEAVKRIIQPTEKDIDARIEQVESAKRVLSEIDVDDIEDYQGFKEALDSRVSTVAKNQDEYLASFTEKYKPDQLGTYTKVGDEIVVTNPVQDALDGLENAYTLSGDAVNATKIKQLRARMEAEGLTVSEINKIARDYNIEFKNKAFDKMGNPKSGFNADNYEAVRKGVKQVARDRMPDDTSKELDAKLSDTYEVRDMIDRLATEVDKAGAKARKQGLVGKVVGAGVEVADVLSGRIISGLLRTLAQKSGVLQKGSISYTELESELPKLIEQFRKLNAQQDPKKFSEEVSEYLNQLQPGLSIRNTASVAQIKDFIAQQNKRLENLRGEGMSVNNPQYKKVEQTIKEANERLRAMEEG